MDEQFARMLAKVKKLLVKAEDPGCTAFEAEALNDKAAEIIARYGIEAALLTRDDPNKREEIVNHRMTFCAPYAQAKMVLANVIAQAYRCRAVKVREFNVDNFKSESVLRVIGYESDINRTELMYSSLSIQAAVQMQMSELFDKPDGENSKAWRNSFLQGFNTAVWKRLRDMERKIVSETNSSMPGTDLVLVDREAAVNLAVTELLGKTTKGSGTVSSGSGRHLGFQAGQRADLGAGRLVGTHKALSG